MATPASRGAIDVRSRFLNCKFIIYIMSFVGPHTNDRNKVLTMVCGPLTCAVYLIKLESNKYF